MNLKFDEYFDRMFEKPKIKQKRLNKNVKEIDILSEIEICDEIINNKFKIDKHKKVNCDDIINYRKELVKRLEKFN